MLPLIADFAPATPLAWRGGRAISQGEFVAQAVALSQCLPQATHAINLCEDRYRFMLALAAVGLRGQVSLLPPSAAAPAVDAVRAAHPGCHAIDDASVGQIEAGSAGTCPALPARQLAAILFTSGSTGVPQPQPKTWATFAAIASNIRERLLASGPVNIVGTVPPQHMFGMESTVLTVLRAGCAVHAGRPFFPQDVARALAEVPAPRLLVTTPVHLRALIASATNLPPLQMILSATAPLSADLAAQAEAAWGAPVHEIYGCTEAGSTATRRTIDGDVWQPLHGMRLQLDGETAILEGDHLPERVPLQDRIELRDDGRFRLLGRNADLLKVAGKRASVADLTQKLLAIPGVQDAVIFDAGSGEAARPAALVVAPDVAESAILEALALQLDPVFLPRPLRKVAQLPRNAMGKLPRDALLQLLGQS